MAIKLVHCLDVKVLLLLIALSTSILSWGALPVKHPAKERAVGMPVRKSPPFSSFNTKGHYSLFRFLRQNHPRVFWREVKLMAAKYLRDHKSNAPQDGKLTEADQKAKNSVVLGAIALALCWLPYTMIPAVVLAVLSIIMSRKAREMGSERNTGKGLAIAALVIAALVLLISVLVVVSFLTGMNLLFQW